jgi:hypothetical protein
VRPEAAARQSGEERPDQRLPGLRPPRRVLAAARGSDVGDLRDRPVSQVVVVLVQVDDVPEPPRPVHEARHVEERDAHRLRARGGRRAGAAPLGRVVVLHVELPGDPAPLEPVEDRLSRPGRTRHPGQPVRHAPAARGREPSVEQDVLARDVPVEGQVAPVVVAHDGRLGELSALRDAADEAVHMAAPRLGTVGGPVVREIRARASSEPEGTHARPRAARGPNRHARARRDPVGSRIRPEVVVEGVVLLHQHHEVPDRRGGPELTRGRWCISRPTRDREREQGSEAPPHGRTS